MKRSTCHLRSLILVAAMAVTTNTAVAQSPLQNFALHELPQPLSEIAFKDGAGKPVSLANFRGKVVLLNIWATWCVPCRREMPTLDRLQAQLGGPAFEVVALSIDRAGIDVVREFYAEVGLKHLGTYIDRSGQASRQLRIAGLPTTLLIDREGRELGRLIGPAEWDSPEMIAFLKSRVEKTSSLSAPISPGQFTANQGNPRHLSTERAGTVALTF